jgi:hypothetical protein
MSITVILTQEEILNTPNDAMLGELTRNKYWQARRDAEGPQYSDEHIGLVIGEDGLVKSINRPYRCSICNKDTSKVDYDYLVGYDHLTCVLEQENKTKKNEYDRCVICAKETPYLVSTHIDMRFFYVEGAGQLCEDCYNK